MPKESNDFLRITIQLPGWMEPLIDQHHQRMTKERRLQGNWASRADAIRSLVTAGLRAKGYPVPEAEREDTTPDAANG